MSSEWLKVMLEEIARKKDEEAQARIEQELRRKDGGPAPEPPPDSSSPAAGQPPGGWPPRGAPPG